ncbi:conserved hypothetical protein [Ricinus communis]|uniref:Uncharacterized protein n=1 Tax=Ricinus communis TaxID=3988 RepID=B9RRM1_RICCO|nr:conserved hypothetical protein [Ricinus communis]
MIVACDGEDGYGEVTTVVLWRQQGNNDNDSKAITTMIVIARLLRDGNGAAVVK